MAKNKLSTLGYFRKRLRDAGIESKVLIKDYIESDKRKWTISIYKDLSIICTCSKTNSANDHNFFNFNDFGQYVNPINTVFSTDSFNVIEKFLKDIREKANGKVNIN